MALDIPMPDSPGDSLIKGVDAGSNLMHKLLLNKYYGQLHPSGDVANAIYVEQLKNQYGENDPRYIQAKAAHDMALQGHQSLMDYRNILNQTAGFRSTSPLGKEIAEGKGQGALDILKNIRRGPIPPMPSSPSDTTANNLAISPDNIEQLQSSGMADNNARTPEEREAYERKINKETSDAQTRTKLNLATNLDKTRKAINSEDLTRYSGLPGIGKYIYESGKALSGNPSEEFINHQKAITAASLMRDQMRQFYGDSIQPKALERLDELTRPSTWYRDPKVAEARWDQLNKILDTETETYRNKGTSPIHLNGLDVNKNGDFILGNAKGNNTSNKTNEAKPDFIRVNGKLVRAR